MPVQDSEEIERMRAVPCRISYSCHFAVEDDHVDSNDGFALEIFTWRPFHTRDQTKRNLRHLSSPASSKFIVRHVLAEEATKRNGALGAFVDEKVDTLTPGDTSLKG